MSCNEPVALSMMYVCSLVMWIKADIQTVLAYPSKEKKLLRMAWPGTKIEIKINYNKTGHTDREGKQLWIRWLIIEKGYDWILQFIVCISCVFMSFLYWIKINLPTATIHDVMSHFRNIPITEKHIRIPFALSLVFLVFWYVIMSHLGISSWGIRVL